MPSSPFRGRIGHTEIVRLPNWAVTLGALVAGALGIAIFLASASLILMLAPVILGAAFYIRWRIRRALRKMAEDENGFMRRPARADEPADIIDGDYRVIDEDENRRRR